MIILAPVGGSWPIPGMRSGTRSSQESSWLARVSRDAEYHEPAWLAALETIKMAGPAVQSVAVCPTLCDDVNPFLSWSAEGNLNTKLRSLLGKYQYSISILMIHPL